MATYSIYGPLNDAAPHRTLWRCATIEVDGIAPRWVDIAEKAVSKVSEPGQYIIRMTSDDSTGMALFEVEEIPSLRLKS